MRSFDDRPIADDDLNQILEAGRRTPSSQNWQPWDFILVRQRGPLFEAVIRALKNAGIAVAGADRMVLTEHIEIGRAHV